MNSIAREANTNGFVTEEQMKEVKEIMEEVYQNQLNVVEIMP